ncbi:hypothetical protein CEXT_299001 [Caerostris extrusa]|uniref:Uncharacterized protein n=1 Tax=Caerostris extrusa TaxID=172846 RepID=A0AAV4V2Y6_CAEEX|nr:hypothetical protein CEXT_299001 [Caerostris extrusa]
MIIQQSKVIYTYLEVIQEELWKTLNAALYYTLGKNLVNKNHGKRMFNLISTSQQFISPPVHQVQKERSQREAHSFKPLKFSSEGQFSSQSITKLDLQQVSKIWHEKHDAMDACCPKSN